MKKLLILFFLLCSFSYGGESTKIVVIVNEVHDGDTFYIDIINTHPVFGKRLPVRVNGIDSPELRSRRSETREKAIEAKKIAESKLLGKEVILSSIKRDKYFRLNADVVVLETKEDFAKFMLDNGFAKPYNGGTKEKE